MKKGGLYKVSAGTAAAWKEKDSSGATERCGWLQKGDWAICIELPSGGDKLGKRAKVLTRLGVVWVTEPKLDEEG